MENYHNQSNSRMKMGNDENLSNVSFIGMGKVTRKCP